MGKGTEGCGLFWCHFHFAEPFSSFTDDKMIPQAITLHNNFIIILSQYIIFPVWTRYLPSKQKSSDLSPLSLPKDYWIHSFWSQNTEKRNNTISQMRLRSVFKMRMSILNTATTEQMGYGSISFFVYTKSTNYYFHVICNCFFCATQSARYKLIRVW